MRMQPSILLSLFRTRKGCMKKEPTGVPFKLFSDSLNMKILPSELAIFTLVKVFEESVYWVIIYLFFDLIRLFYKKKLREFSFKCFSTLYNHEKPSSFLSLDSLKKHRQTHTGLNHSFLGFVKHTLRDSSEG
jgi:hypothetical protein